VPLELSPETVVPPLARSALPVLMLRSEDIVVIYALQEPSLLKVRRISETVLLALLDSLPVTWVPLNALNALLVTTNSTELPVTFALWVLPLMMLLRA